jgi:hypothetical protein
MVDENESVIKKKMSLEQEEKKYQTALKVAHDILAPLKLLKSNLASSQVPLVSSALDQIEKTAFDLLPEKSPFHLEKIELHTLVQHVLGILKIEFPQHVVNVEIPFGVSVLVSKVHFNRALLNLVKNALEVQPIHVPLIIRMKSGSFVELEIVDNGPGFDPKTLTQTTKAQGSGLGIQSSTAALNLMSVDLEFEKGAAGGMITRLQIPRASLELFYGHSQSLKTFGCRLEGIPEIENLSLITGLDYIISPFQCPMESCLGTWKVVSEDDLPNLKLICLTEATLVEDDKYTKVNWLNAAKRVGINLTIESSQVAKVDQQVIFMDRFLGDFDTSLWADALRRDGKTVISVSALDGAGKNPPWV